AVSRSSTLPQHPARVQDLRTQKQTDHGLTAPYEIATIAAPPSLGRNVGKWFLGKADGPGTSFRPDCAGIRCLPSHPRFGARRSAASSQIDQRPPLSSLSVLPANQLRTGAFGRSILARSISARDQTSPAPSVSAE